MKKRSSDGSIEFLNSIGSEIKKRIEKYSFEVGIIQDGPHYRAISKSRKSFAGGPARAQSRIVDGTLGGVSVEVRKLLGFNYLTKPFNKKNSDILNFLKIYLTDVFTPSGKLVHKKRLENLLQAVVRNPILRGDYGSNTAQWARVKGFDRYLIDTAQFFNSIKARVRMNRVSRKA